jgi:ribose transport system permease protein
VRRGLWQTSWRNYTTVLALLLACAVLSLLTLRPYQPTGAAGARRLARALAGQPPGRVWIVGRPTPEDAEFARTLQDRLTRAGWTIAGVVLGEPRQVRQALAEAVLRGEAIQRIACPAAVATWGLWHDRAALGPAAAQLELRTPPPYWWPAFLQAENLLNIANQIVIIAVIAVGMTCVVLGGGIDLSVGSQVAVASVLTARLLRDVAGGTQASLMGTCLCCGLGIAACGLLGAWNGLLVAALRIPPFLVTLGSMSIGSGLAFMISHGETIQEVPLGIRWLMRGTVVAGLPNGVLLMLLLYAAGHGLLTRTVFGRHVYAVGGNRRAAWLSGVPVRRVELFCYVLCGSLAGLAGVLMVSQYRSGAPTYGATYELQVIAAVVVGGTSLSGGQGTMLGTLLGTLLIAVVQNGMNLLGISSDPQKVVLGCVILAAAIIDRLQQRTDLP